MSDELAAKREECEDTKAALDRERSAVARRDQEIEVRYKELPRSQVITLHDTRKFPIII